MKLVCYELKKSTPTQRTKLHRELYGYTDQSNHGKYTYKRTGLLNEIKHRRITDAVILIEKSKARKLIVVLKKFGAKTYVFSIVAEKKG